jgi:hypothetical protein
MHGLGTCGAYSTNGTRRRSSAGRVAHVECNEVPQEFCERPESCYHHRGAVFLYPFEPEDVRPWTTSAHPSRDNGPLAPGHPTHGPLPPPTGRPPAMRPQG